MLTNSVQMRRAVLRSELEKTIPSAGNEMMREELEDVIGKKFDSINDLSDAEVNEAYETLVSRPMPYPDDDPFIVESKKLGIEPNLRPTEIEVKNEIDDILERTQLSAESFVEGTEPTGDLLDIFVDEMKKSGYENKDIADFINDSLDAAKFETGKNFGIIE